MVKAPPFSSAPAQPLRLLRTRLAALSGSALARVEARPLGLRPPPWVLELAASKVAHLPVFDQPGDEQILEALQMHQAMEDLRLEQAASQVNRGCNPM